MKIIKYILLTILIINLHISPAFSSTVAYTGNKYDEDMYLINQSNNILTEVILIIPKEALINANTITSLRFPCGRTFITPPDTNLAFRFFKYYGFGIFEPLDNAYITPSQCIDDFYMITWNLYSIETVDHNFDYAFGMYSASSTNGTWYYPYLSQPDENSSSYWYQWINLSNSSLGIINVSIVDLNGLDFTDSDNNNSKLYNYPYFSVLGTFEVEPTATPTPSPTGTPEIPTNDSRYGTSLNNSTNLNDLYNSTNNPNAIYEISMGNGTGETVGTIVDKINASALGYTVFGFMIFIIRFFSIKKDVN